jgi:hypothetical protein
MTNESLLELWELVNSRDFVSLACLLLIAVAVGSGLLEAVARRSRGLAAAMERPWIRGLLWTAAMAAVAATFYLGVMPHGERGSEWGEVLFNGQLL